MSPDSIRFQCPNCGRPIRCPVDWAGKQAKCPNAECGAQLTVPSPHDAEPAVGVPPPPMQPGAIDPTLGMPQPPDQSPNPYQSPVGPAVTDFGGPPPISPGKVKAPGIALIVVGVLDMLYAIVNGFSPLIQEPGGGAMPREFQGNEFAQGFWNGMNDPSPVATVVMSFVMGIAAVLIILGGIKMINMSSYPLAVTSAILSMVPCITCLGCCGVGQAVGIWALIVLLSADVRTWFQ